MGTTITGLGTGVALAVLVRYLVSLHGHSGEATPPMYGDYEAQRHWMEVTWQLPIGDWYRNTTDNDLQCALARAPHAIP